MKKVYSDDRKKKQVKIENKKKSNKVESDV